MENVLLEMALHTLELDWLASAPTAPLTGGLINSIPGGGSFDLVML